MLDAVVFPETKLFPGTMRAPALAAADPEVAAAIAQEEERQRTVLEMIASENYVSVAVLEAAGTVTVAGALDVKLHELVGEDLPLRLRAALLEFQVLGVVGSPLRPRRRKPVPKTQLEMFE